MSHANSNEIVTNQDDLNQNLDEVVLKHLNSTFGKPYSEHSLAGFRTLERQVEQAGKPLIFDSCCGVGESSVRLAAMYPDHLVIGMDKSAHRLEKNERQEFEQPDNLVLLRTDLNDFWRLALEAGMLPERHFVLYPNPWPKAKHLQRRWHGAPVFPTLVALGGQLELRSNWQLYLREFARALELAGKSSQLLDYRAEQPLTAFERKYWASGQPTWQLSCDLNQA